MDDFGTLEDVSVTTSLRSDAVAPGAMAGGLVLARRSLESPAAASLVVERWFKFGMRRLYVNTADGDLVGWVDLASGERRLAMPELAAAFDAAVTAAQTNGPRPYRPRRSAMDTEASPMRCSR